VWEKLFRRVVPLIKLRRGSNNDLKPEGGESVTSHEVGREGKFIVRGLWSGEWGRDTLRCKKGKVFVDRGRGT